jgi:hypothetical protein
VKILLDELGRLLYVEPRAHVQSGLFPEIHGSPPFKMSPWAEQRCPWAVFVLGRRVEFEKS